MGKLKDVIEILKQELADCYKREIAARAVFINNFEKEQALSQKTLELELKESSLKLREADLDMKIATAEAEQKQLECRKTLADRHVMKQKIIADTYKAEIKQATGQSAGQLEAGVRAKATQPHRIHPPPSAYTTLFEDSTFHMGDDSQFDKYILPVSAQSMESEHVLLLRAHDYYKGWLDSMIAQDRQKGLDAGWLRSDDFGYLRDSSDLRSPLSAGRFVGLLFGWSALCAKYGYREHDVRLDGRTWSLSDLNPFFSEATENFWTEVEEGIKGAKAKFMTLGIELSD